MAPAAFQYLKNHKIVVYKIARTLPRDIKSPLQSHKRHCGIWVYEGDGDVCYGKLHKKPCQKVVVSFAWERTTIRPKEVWPDPPPSFCKLCYFNDRYMKSGIVKYLYQKFDKLQQPRSSHDGQG